MTKTIGETGCTGAVGLTGSISITRLTDGTGYQVVESIDLGSEATYLVSDNNTNKIVCKHCGQWVKMQSSCAHCGAPAG